MLLSGALFALFMTGFWLYCLTDAILTPAAECRGMSKPAWIVVITLTFVGGAIAWLVVRPSARNSSVPSVSTSRWDPDGSDDENYFLSALWTEADDAAARHPAGRARVADGTLRAPKGPDDDLEFLRALDRAIHGGPEAS